MSAPIVSMVEDATSTKTRDVNTETIIKAVRGGRWREPVEMIRRKFRRVMAENGGDRTAAKKAVDPDKKQLPGIMFSGRFSRRTKNALLEHSGLICADLDGLNERIAEVRKNLLHSVHLFALFCSPTGDGLKAIFRVAADSDKHPASYRAVEEHVMQLTGIRIDEGCKDVARLCFVSFDPDAYLNIDAIELPPIIEAEKAEAKGRTNAAKPEIEIRQRIAVELLGRIEWTGDAHGYCVCPGKHLHTTGDGARDCEIHLDGAPTIHCFHDHCRGIRDGANRELRSQIGKAERSNSLGTSGEDGNENKSVRGSAATRLVRLADNFAFFHDPQDRPFVRLEINGHMEVWPVESSKFRKLLARTFYKHTGRAINRNAIADAITTLAGRACHDSPEESVFLRVAPQSENILIDLCDAEWRVVEVTPNGWQVIEKSPVAFVRTGSMQSLPEPMRGGSINGLWDLLNVTEAQRPLVAGALLNAFHPHGPYFVLNFVGEQGTAKSCAARISRQLVDPNENPLRSPPKEERDLLAQAASNRCVALDNLSSLPPWLSDALCRLATGGGHSARTLYTDLEEISLAVKRPVILNGIEDVATRPDLAERVLQIELETIPDEKRISEKDLWGEFEKQRSVIFSALLDALVCALRELPNVTLNSLPRMADAALWATAGETAFGFKRGAFMAAYQKNLDESAITSVESSLVGLAIVRLFENKETEAETEAELIPGEQKKQKEPVDQWQGETSELLEALSLLVTEKEARDNHWPKNPRALGHALRRLAPALRRAGFGLERVRANRRILILTKKCKDRKKTSRTSGTSFYEGEGTSPDIVGTSSGNVQHRRDSTQQPDVCDVSDVSFPTLHTSSNPAQKSDKRDVGRI
jgi:hypothetical protein